MEVALTMATQKTAPSQKACTLQHPSLPALLLKGAWYIQDLKQHLKPQPQLQCHLESPALHPTAAAGNISSSSLLLQRAIEKWGQTRERAFSIFSIYRNLLGPSTWSLWRVLGRFNYLSWTFGCVLHNIALYHCTTTPPWRGELRSWPEPWGKWF